MSLTAEQVGRVLAVIVDDALGEQQGRAGDGGGGGGDADGFQRLVGARVGQPVGDVDLAGRAGGLAVDEAEIGDAGEVLEADADRARLAVAHDHRQRLGVAGIGTGQLGALEFWIGSSSTPIRPTGRSGLIVEQAARRGSCRGPRP